MKLLITGASGMVGHALVHRLNNKGSELLTPSSSELDLTSELATINYFKKYKPDFVFHLAGYVGNLEENNQFPAKFYFSNISMALNILQAAFKINCKNVLNLSSACVYPTEKSILNENDLLQGPLDESRESYSLAKLSAVYACNYMSQEYLVNYKSIIACNLYGPHDRVQVGKTHFMMAAILKISKAIAQGDQVVDIWGDGTARRELLYVDDLAKYLINAIEKISILPSCLNLGSGMDQSIKEYYQVIAKILGYQGRFNYDHTKPSGVPQRLLDISLAKTLGWEIETSLENGVHKTVDWLRQQKIIEE